jgi:2'-5' RNA ligase
MNIGYVEILFNSEEKQILINRVRSLLNQNDLYYSDVVQRIAGDVTKSLHLTLYFGLIDEDIDHSDLRNVLEKINIKEVKIKSIDLWNGYQDLYKILVLSIDDSDKLLAKYSNQFSKFPHEKEYEFKPHITLAYVKNTFVMPNTIVLPNKILVSDVRYRLLN